MFDLVFWGVQGIGLVALAVSAYSYQTKTRKQILSTQLVGSLIYIVHFGLLSAWTGAVMHGIVSARNWVFLEKNNSRWAKHSAWMWFFMALTLSSLFFTWEGYISLFPAVAMLFGVYARWHENERLIRLFTVIGVSLWIPYTVAVQSYAGTLTQIVFLIATLFGIWKYDRTKSAIK